MQASDIKSLVAMVADRVDPAGHRRSEVRGLVCGYRTKRYEEYSDGSPELAELCEAVAKELAE